MFFKTGKKKIYFVSPFQKSGTFVLRGIQVKNALLKVGIPAYAVRSRAIKNIKNSIIVFVKNISVEYCEIARKNGNIIIWDILDGYDLLTEVLVKASKLDAVIYSNKMHLHDTSTIIPDSTLTKVIYHHIDKRLERFVKQSQQSKAFLLGYIGLSPLLAPNVAYTDKIENLQVVATDTNRARDCSWMKSISPFNCHYNVRLDALQQRYKPFAKIGVAAACNANIITNAQFSSKELLGENYPFFTNDDYESVKKVIEFTRDSFGEKPWNEGLKRMSEIKHLLSLDTLVGEYRSFFKMLC